MEIEKMRSIINEIRKKGLCVDTIYLEVLVDELKELVSIEEMIETFNKITEYMISKQDRNFNNFIVYLSKSKMLKDKNVDFKAIKEKYITASNDWDTLIKHLDNFIPKKEAI